MKVYIVMDNNQECFGVFSNKDKAISEIKENNSYRNCKPSIYSSFFQDGPLFVEYEEEKEKDSMRYWGYMQYLVFELKLNKWGGQ